MTTRLAVAALVGLLAALVPSGATAHAVADVAPTFTFSADTELTGTEQATIDVEDATPGLEAIVGSGRTQPLHDGEQVLRLEEGRTIVTVRTCDDSGCRYFEPRATYIVRKGRADPGGTSPGVVLPDSSDSPDAIVTYVVGDTVDYRFDGHLEDGRDTSTDGLPGVSVANLRPDSQGRIHVPVDLTPLPHGTYSLVGTLSRTTSDGEVVQFAPNGYLGVDRRGPRAYDEHLDTDLFHPRPDGYRDRVRIEADIVDDDTDRVRVRMLREGTDEQVVVPSALDTDTDELTAEWDGHTADGELAPAGAWTAVVDAVDQVGNEQRTVLGTVRLTHKRMVRVTRTYRVSAAGSRIATRTQRCARVVRGPGPWTRGLGYRVGSCQGDADAVTYHQLDRRPRGWMGGTVAVGGYGREVSRPGGLGAPDRALLTMSRTRADVRLGHRERWNDTRPRPYRRLLDDAGALRWRVVATSSTRYDVKAFRVQFVGRALR